MHLNSDISGALQQLEIVKQGVEESNDPKLQMNTADDLKLIFDILQDPIFRNMAQIQDSLAELNSQISLHPSMTPDDFEITTSGEFTLSGPAADEYTPEYADDQRVPSAQISPRSPNSPIAPPTHAFNHNLIENDHLSTLQLTTSTVLDNFENQQAILLKQKNRGIDDLISSTRVDSNDDERPQSVISEVSKNNLDLSSFEWTQVQAIELVNDGTGLGFGIIGARTSGVIVKTILPGGVADRDARLLSGDHILQIGDVNLHEMGSEQVASVLRQSGTHVRLVVARPVDPLLPSDEVEGAAIVPSRLLGNPNELQKYLADAGYQDIFGTSSTPSTPSTQNDRFVYRDDSIPQDAILDMELPETEKFTIELTKDYNGLGITIAGYVCEKEELSGIFVKSVSPGSAADISGRIQVNDRIIEVDGQSLQGYNNHQAVDVLKQSGNIVKLCLERYLRGPKFEQLQQAIAANELKPSTPNTPPPPLPTTFPPISARIHNNISTNSSRRSSITKYTDDYGSDYANDKISVPIKKHNDNNLPIAVVPALTSFSSPTVSNRKLIYARDSIENKIDTEDWSGHPNTVSGVSIDLDNPVLGESYLETSNVILSKMNNSENESDKSIIKKWRGILGPEVHVIVAHIKKFAASSGLGISLEGTVDVEGGREVRPHHYIRSILPEGPVGLNGLLMSGDELLEVNGHLLLGMDHLNVVSILKELPQHVRMVCCRGSTDMLPFTEESLLKSLEDEVKNDPQNLMPDRLVKAKSDGSLATTTGVTGDAFNKMKSRSLEPLTGLAMWSSEAQIIELVKGERGLGFSILDYQDPLDPNDTLIVIRSLVPGGVAQLDGRLIPGDRLLFVNEIVLENASLDQAVQALKGAPKGIVKIGVAKPLPMADSSINFGEKSFDSSMNGSGGGGGGNELNNKFLKSIKPDVILE